MNFTEVRKYTTGLIQKAFSNKQILDKLGEDDNTLTFDGEKVLPFKLGVDDSGNYGYYKDGADTLTPFNESKEPVPYGGTRMRGLYGKYGIATQIL